MYCRSRCRDAANGVPLLRAAAHAAPSQKHTWQDHKSVVAGRPLRWSERLSNFTCIFIFAFAFIFTLIFYFYFFFCFILLFLLLILGGAVDEETAPDRLNIHGSSRSASEHAPREPPWESWWGGWVAEWSRGARDEPRVDLVYPVAGSQQVPIQSLGVAGRSLPAGERVRQPRNAAFRTRVQVSQCEGEGSSWWMAYNFILNFNFISIFPQFKVSLGASFRGPRISLGASGGASCLAGGRARGAGLVCESGGPCGGGAPWGSDEGSWGPIRLGSEVQFLCAVSVKCISEFVCEHSRDLRRPPRAIYLNLNLILTYIRNFVSTTKANHVHAGLSILKNSKKNL